MIEAIINLLPLVVFIVCIILWIRSIMSSDGKCHMDCGHCPWNGGCEHEDKVWEDEDESS